MVNRFLLAAFMAAAAWAQTTTAVPAVLTSDQVLQLEAKIAANPTDLVSQKRLAINYAYFVPGVTAVDPQFGNPTAFDPTKANSDFAAYVRQKLVSSDYPTVVGEAGNAIWNFGSYASHTADYTTTFLHQARVRGAKLADRAVKLDPANETWRNYRIPILAFRSSSTSVLPLRVGLAYQLARTDFRILLNYNHQLLLITIAELAIRANALDDVEAYAAEILSLSIPNGGNLGFIGPADGIYYGNRLMGRVAFMKGNLAEAKARLLASGNITPGPTVFGWYQPDFSLAQLVLNSGDSGTVVNFLTQYELYWTSGADQLNIWIAQIQAGQTPFFYPNNYLNTQ